MCSPKFDLMRASAPAIQVVLLLLFVGLVSASLLPTTANAASLAAVVEDSDVIVIARSTVLTASTNLDSFTLSLEVVEVLLGAEVDGTLQARLQRQLERSYLPTGGCGMWFLVESDSGFNVLPPPGSGPFMQMQYLPFDSCSSDAEHAAQIRSSSLESVEATLLAVASRGGVISSELLRRVFPLVNPHSNVVKEYAVEVSKSNNSLVRAAGLSWLILGGNSEAFSRLADEFDVLWSPGSQSMIVTGIRETRLENDRAVPDIERLLDVTGTEHRYLRYALANVLRMRHTRPTLPALAKLLRDGDDRLRRYAVWGFSAYAARVPPITESDPARALEASQRPTADGLPEVLVADTEREFIRFDQFSDIAEENSVVSFWTEWWNRQPESNGARDLP